MVFGMTLGGKTIAMVSKRAVIILEFEYEWISIMIFNDI
jgi:hypothetical protein